MLQHKHLVVSAKVKKPPTDADSVCSWLKLLIKHIGMELVVHPNIPANPQAFYSEKAGNQGVTGTAILTTSHCAIHVWDDVSPAKLELDVYSCSDFKVEDIIPYINLFYPVEIKYKFFDREDGISILEESSVEV
jgi:S-adenosylmethionine/arginine decarboxylase-like enzyme